MPKLRQIKLENFQAHRDLTIPVEPGVNVIVGPTNAGKSSVFRALRWLVEHKPASGLQTFDTDSMSVSIETDEGKAVERFKTKTEYGYKAEGATFLACATKQPPEIQAILGLSPINLQGQHDPPFLLTLTPGQMAKELNRIVDLSIIDKANSFASSGAMQAKGQVEATAKLLEKHQEEVAKWDWVESCETNYHQLVKVGGNLRELSKTADLLSEQIASIVAVDAELAKLIPLVEQAEGLLDRHLLIQKQSVGAEILRKLLFDNSLVLSKLIKITVFEGQCEALSLEAQSIRSMRGHCDRASETIARLAANAASISSVNKVGTELAKLKKQASAISVNTSLLAELSPIVDAYHKATATTSRLDPMLGDLVEIAEVATRLDRLSDKNVELFRLFVALHHNQSGIDEQAETIKTLEPQVKLCPTCNRPM